MPVLYEGIRCRKNGIVAWDTVPAYTLYEIGLVIDAQTWAD